MAMTSNTQLEGLLDVMGRTGDAMVAVDADLRIVGWNDAATALLGHSPEQVIGRPCHEVLCWNDRCGNDVCSEECPASSPGEPDEVIATRQVLGRSAQGQRLWLDVSTIVPPFQLREECRLVHLVREVSLPPELERVVAERIEGNRSVPNGSAALLDTLTPREREVLDLLTQGLDGAGIARRLVLSPATVRNHIQHILKKLDARSRVEAVALALRNPR